MSIFRSVIDTFTLGSERPIRRLLAYYAILASLGALVFWLWPAAGALLFDEATQAATETPYLLQDGLGAALSSTVSPGVPSTVQQLLLTALSLVGAIGLMLPVSWVYMSARNVRGHNQAVVQTLIILPIVVAGIVFVVRNSLALAFSLAGVVAAVRFRTTLRDARDVVFIFLAIAVGFAAGVSMLGAGTLVSIMFNFVVLLTWRYDFGRSMLAPTAASQWRDPLSSLAASNGHAQVPDRDLLLALTPTKVSQLADRFERVRAVMGTNKGKPRYNAVLSVTSDHVSEAQALVQRALDQCVKRWVLDEVVTHAGKPSELFYLVRVPRRTTRDEILTAVRAQAADKIGAADLEIAQSFEETEAA
ncbi:MAG: DUF4956 domain-containing protein [Cytophagaceae bacterium]|nr:DUF4956 domain-containing protein [Gemmatimonadaceae bacterium]